MAITIIITKDIKQELTIISDTNSETEINDFMIYFNQHGCVFEEIQFVAETYNEMLKLRNQFLN